MFTGIVEEKGSVRYMQLTGESGVLAVRAKKVLERTKIGDSIAVNGVCLTVTSLQPDGFTADVMAETIRRSSLGSCKVGSQVNLENDVIGKYVERLLGLGKSEEEKKESGITMEFLQEFGF